jgi:hypothetical protein
MNWRCALGIHFWWIKAMTPYEIRECTEAGAPWPELTEICLRCRKERPSHNYRDRTP